MESQFINRRILITKPELNGKRLGQLKLRKLYGINITRINRAGVDLVATPHLTLQVGDRVNVVGTETAVTNVEKVLGNSMNRHRPETTLYRSHATSGWHSESYKSPTYIYNRNG